MMTVALTNWPGLNVPSELSRTTRARDALTPVRHHWRDPVNRAGIGHAIEGRNLDLLSGGNQRQIPTEHIELHPNLAQVCNDEQWLRTGNLTRLDVAIDDQTGDGCRK